MRFLAKVLTIAAVSVIILTWTINRTCPVPDAITNDSAKASTSCE
jgi:hypothetical protein